MMLQGTMAQEPNPWGVLVAVADPRSRSLQDMHTSIPGITSAGQVGRVAAQLMYVLLLLRARLESATDL